MLALPQSMVKVSLSGSTYLCTGYAECQAAGYTHAGYKQASSTMYWRMYAGHNCTNYVAYRLIQNGMPNSRPWDGGGNARHWGVEMASLMDQVPRVGSVAWYPANVSPAGPAGHVAYVEQVISPTEIIVSEDYWGGDFHWRRITQTGSGWPRGFIHFNDRAVEATTAPAIAGAPVVGAPVEVSTGTWSPAPTQVALQWLADGVAIPGATSTTYVPTPEVKGQALAVEVTAALEGYSPGVAVLTTEAVAPGLLQAAGLPAIQGNPEVGQTLTLSAPSWSPQPARTKTQWFADGAPLRGENGTTLVLTRDHVGSRISARVTGTAKGYRKSISDAVETGPVLAKPVTITRPFSITGRAEVGRTLVARPGVVRPSNASATYRWLRDGQPIAKARNGRYTLRRKDVGRSLAVEVTLTQRNFRATTDTVPLSASITTVPTMRVRSDARRGRVAVDVRVRAPGVRRPEGVVSVRIGGRVVEGQLTHGRARLVVRKLGSGTKPLVVRYRGTDLVQPAVSRSTIDVPGRR
ncbi:CHAP domain-containing protein [Nocardioides seonyuensis]|uniref:CHAP domain-containing protein n=1 Tax=Nocardioides seonyuensis TaxID=2518371 RepID=A0A4P7IL40_9ACTN|nr:CHAP domain-containing protein [Nocardioides seonyuensis]QBX56761.1 CHAP domain-containing protein [Nocardioides seonyuensis]